MTSKYSATITIEINPESSYSCCYKSESATGCSYLRRVPQNFGDDFFCGVFAKDISSGVMAALPRLSECVELFGPKKEVPIQKVFGHIGTGICSCEHCTNIRKEKETCGCCICVDTYVHNKENKK